MKTIIVLFIILASSHADIDALGQPRTEWPHFTNGAFWQYRVTEQGDYLKTERELNGLYEVAYTNGHFKVFKLEMNRKNEIQTGTGVLIGLVGQTPLQHMQFPLFPGKSWTTEYTFRPRRREVDRQVQATTKITAFGEVRIDLGPFESFTLERDARFKHVDHWSFVYHWSPRTKSVVKYRMDVLKGDAVGNKREIELIRFGLPG